MEEGLFYKENDSCVYIRATGHITASLCTDLRNKVNERIQSQAPLSLIAIDLSDCDYMDSTFMGLIVGFHKSIDRIGGKVRIHRASPVCQELLKKIGLDRISEMSDEALRLPPFMENLIGAEKATAEFLLGAHEDLMDLSEENRARFSTLTSVLKSQIKGRHEDDDES